MEDRIASLTGKFVKSSLILTVYFIWVEMVSPPLFISSKVNFKLLIATVCIFGLYFFLNKTRQLPIESPDNKKMVVALAAYFLMDLAGIFYSRVPYFAFERYTGHASMAALSIVMIFAIKSRREIYRIFSAIGLASLTLSAISLYLSLSGGSMGLTAGSRVSLSSDYNEFGTQIIIGTGILLFILIGSKSCRFISTLLSILAAVFNVSVVLLTGSRRSVILLIAMAAFITFYFLWVLSKRKKLIPAAIGLLIFSLSAYFVIKTAVAGLYSFDTHNSSTLISRYNTLLSGKAFASRLTRWNTALEEFREFGFLEIFIGRGTAYDNYFFSNVYTAELGSDYPHNTFLSDLLNGGLLKAGIMMAVCMCIFKQLSGIWKRDRKSAFILIFSWIIIFVNNFISGDGIFLYKPFWIFLSINIVVSESMSAGRELHEMGAL